MSDYLKPSTERERLTVALADEITEALSYTLRYDPNGEPHRSGSDLVATIAAEWLTEQIERSGLKVLKAPPVRQHSTG